MGWRIGVSTVIKPHASFEESLMAAEDAGGIEIVGREFEQEAVSRFEYRMALGQWL